MRPRLALLLVLAAPWLGVEAQRAPTPPDTATLRAAEARAGTNAEQWVAIAVAWLARRDTTAAMAVLEQGVVAARPARLVRLALAELHLRRGASTEALAVLAPLPPRDSTAAPLRAVAEAQRAFVLLGRADTAAALASLERAWALRRDEATGIALVQLARLARSTRGGPLADTLVARPGASPAAFSVAAEVAAAQGRLLHADSVLVRGTARHPKAGTLWLALGDVRKERRAWRDGAHAYRRAAGLLPEADVAELALARLYLAAQDTGAALGTWREMGQPARAAYVRHAAAERLARFGAGAAAESVYVQLVQEDSTDAQAWAGLAGLAEARGERGVALRHWRQADGARDPSPWPAVALLRVLPAEDLEARRRAASRAVWRGLRVLREREQASGTGVAPLGASAGTEDDPIPEPTRLQSALQPLVDSLAADTAWGVAELAAVTRAFGDGRLVRLARARAAFRRGEVAVAADLFAALVREQPADPALRAEHATSLRAAGRRVDAGLAWAQVLERQPEDSVAFRALVQLAASPAELEALASRIARLRERRPGSAVLAERELELWHRLDRRDDATRVAAELAMLKRRQAAAEGPPR